jgi:acyl-CoA thioesterase-2
MMSSSTGMPDGLGFELEDGRGPDPADGSHRWRMAVRTAVLTGAGAVQGGVLLAAAVEALERTSGRPVLWATGQYLCHVGPDAVIDISVATDVEGRHTTQAAVVLRVDGVDVLRAIGAAGRRPARHSGRWAAPRRVPGPDRSVPVVLPAGPPGGMLDRFEVRTAAGRTFTELDGTPGSGRSALWCRVPGPRRVLSAADLAIVGDFVMLGFSDALGVRSTGNSLDNTIRVVARAESSWVLLDITVDAAVDGFGHASARLWGEDGATLLGVASQTLVLREPDDAEASVRRRRIVGR